ncbi:MAG: hypothetical protein KDB80_00240 [Planctomycetes bacterium]|nr:hypothetical protein [Planctomycetota bacterium]
MSLSSRRVFHAGVVPLLLIAVLAQCSSLDRKVALQPSDQVVVTCYQPAARGKVRHHEIGALQQSLATEPRVDEVDYYSAPQTDPLRKLVSTETMQLLLDALATAGYFEHAAPLPAALPDRPGLIVDVNGQRSYFGRSPTHEPSVHQVYTVCWTAFQDVYNATKAYRTGVGSNSVREKHAEQMQSRGVRR